MSALLIISALSTGAYGAPASPSLEECNTVGAEDNFTMCIKGADSQDQFCDCIDAVDGTFWTCSFADRVDDLSRFLWSTSAQILRKPDSAWRSPKINAARGGERSINRMNNVWMLKRMVSLTRQVGRECERNELDVSLRWDREAALAMYMECITNAVGDAASACACVKYFDDGAHRNSFADAVDGIQARLFEFNANDEIDEGTAKLKSVRDGTVLKLDKVATNWDEIKSMWSYGKAALDSCAVPQPVLGTCDIKSNSSAFDSCLQDVPIDDKYPDKDGVCECVEKLEATMTRCILAEQLDTITHKLYLLINGERDVKVELPSVMGGMVSIRDFWEEPGGKNQAVLEVSRAAKRVCKEPGPIAGTCDVVALTSEFESCIGNSNQSGSAVCDCLDEMAASPHGGCLTVWSVHKLQLSLMENSVPLGKFSMDKVKISTFFGTEESGYKIGESHGLYSRMDSLLKTALMHCVPVPNAVPVPTPTAGDDSSVAVGVVIGIIAGVVVLSAIIAASVYFCRKNVRGSIAHDKKQNPIGPIQAEVVGNPQGVPPQFAPETQP